MLNKLLYVTSGYYNGVHSKYTPRYESMDASIFAYLILAGVVGLFMAGIIYFNWDMLEDWWIRIRDRHKIKAITIKIAGKDMSPYKVEKLTDDINTILSGKSLPQILESHKLSATDIISMSAVPQHDCFLFTVWYK